NPADAQRYIEREGPGRDHLDVALAGGLPQLHDGALAVLALNLAERRCQCPIFFRHALPSFSQAAWPASFSLIQICSNVNALTTPVVVTCQGSVQQRKGGD